MYIAYTHMHMCIHRDVYHVCMHTNKILIEKQVNLFVSRKKRLLLCVGDFENVHIFHAKNENFVLYSYAKIVLL